MLSLIAVAPLWAALRAGAAAVDITPVEWPVRLIGNFGVTLAPAAHDALHARAIVLQDGGVTLAIALIDSCYVKAEEIARIKTLVARRTGLPAARVMIAATHTHSAPPSRAEAGNALEQRYVERLIEGTAEAIAQAHGKLAPARIGWGSVAVGDEVFNRRWFLRPGAIPADPFGQTTDRVRMNPPGGSPDLQHPAGPTDPGFSVVSLQTADGRPLALLANYSLHYVGGTPDKAVSADYFGEFSRRLAERLPGVVAMLTNGTSGDVNNIDFIHPRGKLEPFARIRQVAGKLVDQAVALAGSIQYVETLPLAAQTRPLRLAYRKPTSAQLAFARRALAEPDESKLPRNAKAYAERAQRLQAGPAYAEVELQAFRLGALGIAALPFETFAETGLAIKELSPFAATFTIELANGHFGYLPPPRHHALGGYETWLGTSNVEPEASVKITRALLDMLNATAGSR